jgi:hypothetical protein
MPLLAPVMTMVFGCESAILRSLGRAPPRGLRRGALKKRERAEG